MENAAIILAAGAGTRMKSKKPKVAHEILGKPLVRWVVDSAKKSGVDGIVSVVGHGADQVRPLLEGDGDIVVQQRQLGTADAVRTAVDADLFEGFHGSVLVLSGDCPLITPDTLERLLETRRSENAGCIVLTMMLEDPFGYGRIVRDEDTFDFEDGRVLRIVEQKDASDEEALICECNSGFYCFDYDLLKSALEEVGSDNAQNEFYLTDVLEILRNKGEKCLALVTDDASECLGVNSRVQLAQATSCLQKRINCELMDGGVTMMSPESVWVGPDVEIERDVTILPNVMLFGKTKIGEDSVIGPNTRLTDTSVGRGCVVDETVAVEAFIDDRASTGPRAYLRPEAHLCEGSKAGTHVEIKKSTVGPHSKVPHLSYIGDTTIGENVNIGAGSITCNYDGKNKHHTVIGDNTFIGSDTMMVAPVEIGADAVVGAGSVITKDVPDGTLAVARAREKLIEGWSAKYMK